MTVQIELALALLEPLLHHRCAVQNKLSCEVVTYSTTITKNHMHLYCRPQAPVPAVLLIGTSTYSHDRDNSDVRDHNIAGILI